MVRDKKNFQKKLPDVVILCGGMGTRLKPVVSDRPKPLAEIGDKPFLDILIENIFNQGATRVILAVGHMKEKIIEKYSHDPRILFSGEESPLGTGGALIRAMDLVETENFIAMNGDSYCEADLNALCAEHANRKPIASIVLANIDDISDLGSVSVDNNGNILAYHGKLFEQRAGLVNAGIYVFEKRIKDYAPNRGSFSLENDLFPVIIKEFCYGHIISGGVLDIGTPERYELARKNLSRKKDK